MKSLESMAAEFQDKTGCDDKTAVAMSLATAMLLADLVGDTEAAEHFAARVKQVSQ
jgi:hypothetical protein